MSCFQLFQECGMKIWRHCRNIVVWSNISNTLRIRLFGVMALQRDLHKMKVLTRTLFMTSSGTLQRAVFEGTN